MRISVDMSRCETHAQCVFAAPQVFALDEDDELVYDPEPDDTRQAAVEEAARACPVQAVLVETGRP
ncbi:MAG TPA: ferredoxin [Glycomyces sp.]|nr:ferredoxin [Glycomyces sp.]